MIHSRRILVFLLFSTLVLAGVVRLFWLDKFPPSLYTDEINQGYNAYSILATGRDEHGVFLPISLRSFGDWKPPLQTYSMIPAIVLFGLNEFAIRFPSALLGLGTILLTFFFAKELFRGEKNSFKLALLSSFLLAISPWHILESRAAMLVMVGLFFFELAIYLFILSLRNQKFLVLSSFSFILTMYAYYGFRLITPITVFILLFIYRKNISFTSKAFLISVCTGIILLAPLLFVFLQNTDVVLGRARTVSIFYDQGVKLKQWELITQDGIQGNPLISRFFHNNVFLYGKDILQRFLSHFDGRYLFLIGDQVQPFQIPQMGILYLIDGIFSLIGFFIFFRLAFPHKIVLLLWLIASFIPAALTFLTPASNRTFTAVVPFMIFGAVGLAYFLKKKKYVILYAWIISIFYSVSFGYFLYQYFIVLPIQHADWWNFGWKETAQYVNSIQDTYKDIVVFDVNGMPYIYFLFYGQIDPKLFQKQTIRTYVEDRFGFEHVEGFGKFLFPNNWEWKYMKNDLQKKTLYVIPANQAETDSNYIKAISYPNGQVKSKIFAHD